MVLQSVIINSTSGLDQTPESQPKKKKPLVERIKEKQEKRRQEMQAKEEVILPSK